MLDHVLHIVPEAASWPHCSAWLTLLKNSDRAGMMTLLQGFDAGDRKTAATLLHALGALEAESYSSRFEYKRLSLDQLGLLKICRFVCFEFKDIRALGRDAVYDLPGDSTLVELLRRHVPSWFADVYTPAFENDTGFGRDFSYKDGIVCERMGVPVLGPLGLARKLSCLLHDYRWDCLDLSTLFNDFPEILNRDVWLLFSRPGALPLGGKPAVAEEYRKRFRILYEQLTAAGAPHEDIADILKKELGAPEREPYGFLAMAVAEMIDMGHISRERVLRECLLGICRDVSKDQVSGFWTFFTDLAPTPTELSYLQGELIAVLGCPHSRPVTGVLKMLKGIINHKDFDHAAFAGIVAVPLSSRIKSMQAAALAAVEKSAGKMPSLRDELAQSVAQVFCGTDETVQIRAAKFLLKYGDPENTQLRAELGGWRDNMTAAARDLLRAFLDSPAPSRRRPEEAGACGAPRVLLLDESRRVTVPQTLDDCLFMLAEAFGNPAEYHCGLVPDALLAVRDQLDDESLGRFGPAITAARKVISSLNTTPTVHARTPALHFLRYMADRLEASPGKGKGVAALKKKLPEIRKEASSTYIVYQWDTWDKRYRRSHYPPLYTAFYGLNRVVEAAFARLRTGDALPMLSSVTHAPCWIEPAALAARLHILQEAGREPDSMDMQLALQRCARENAAEASDAVNGLKGECRALLRYFLGKDGTLPHAEVEHREWWITAALMRPERCVPKELVAAVKERIPSAYLTGCFDWSIEPLETDGPDSEKEFTTTSSRRIHIALPFAKSAPYYLSFAAVDETAPVPPDCLFNEHAYTGWDVSLLHQALMLCPNNPEPLVMDILAGYGREKYWKALAVFEKLSELRVPQGPASNLFLALGFLTGAKEPRLHAAAFWRAKVEEGVVDSAEVGRILGRLERGNWVPTKRFTDLVEKEMLGISPMHSARLADMLGAMLLEVGPKPPVNIKRVLELYYELLAAQGKCPNADFSSLLDAWEKEKPYAACVKKLRALNA